VREYVDEQCATLVEPGDGQGMVRAVLDIIGDRSGASGWVSRVGSGL
jgi:hypothetical protein